MIDPKLKDKTVLITGANHGIGAATAKAFAKQGAKVFLTYYREPIGYTQAELEAAEAAGQGATPSTGPGSSKRPNPSSRKSETPAERPQPRNLTSATPPIFPASLTAAKPNLAR